MSGAPAAFRGFSASKGVGRTQRLGWYVHSKLLADIWFNLGYARKKSGNLQDALEAFHRATEVYPDHCLA
ncbi:MAG: hypothetical protein B7Y41_01230 [Hydrogenophilales bacterium 28-61-23]|nr:MAG: hypothetical protein B7Y41_01230 [Hydrogenophilales bacterium 28-61-23]